MCDVELLRLAEHKTFQCPPQAIAQVSGIGHSASDWLRGSDVEKFAAQAAAAPQVRGFFCMCFFILCIKLC